MNLSDSEKARLKHKYGEWALVTGATSGIGLELATRLAGCGFNLVINARSKNNLQNIAAKLQNEFNVQVKPIAADLSVPDSVQQLIEEVNNLNIGLFVASAGFGTSGQFIKADIEEELKLVRVNCEAVLALTYHFSRYFARQQRGGIILLSSLVAFQGVPNAANYAASKAYIQSLAEGLDRELKPLGVDVLAAAPGPVQSGFGTRANMQMGNAAKPEEIGVPILKALGKSSVVVPGVLSKLLTYSLKTLPRTYKVRVMELVMKGFTKHQQ